MNKSIILGLMVMAGASLTGCDDFLNDNRFPITQETDNAAYWGNPDNCVLQESKMYNWFSGYGNGAGQGWYYYKTLSDDQVGSSFTNWSYINVPAAASDYSDHFTYIRACNYVIDRVKSASPALSEANLANFVGIAKLNRAYQYYQLVRQYGDIQWVGDIMEVTDLEALHTARTDRDIVMDSVLNDINYAVAGIAAQSGKQVWSRDMALAMKSEICLYEGTYCKYRTQAENGKAADAARAEKYLKEAAAAAKELITSGRYEINTKTATGDYDGFPYNIGAYQYNYNQALGNSTTNSEMIFVKGYNDGVLMHSVINFTCSTTALSGISKDAFDNYLFKDGLPLASTTENKSDVGVVDEAGNYNIKDILAVRDARLRQTIDTVVFYPDMTWSRAGALQMTSRSGYGISKFDNTSMPLAQRVNANTNVTCAPIYWLSYVMLNYAEAQAELGILSNDDMDLTINELFKRAELPTRTVAELENIKDPANNMGVSSLLWEIRRCRRCELIMDNWIRYWDLVRWHQLDKLDSTKYPNILLGANMTAAPVTTTNVNGYVQAYTNERVFDKKYYFYPIPSNQLNLNPNLTQNPGWK